MNKLGLIVLLVALISIVIGNPYKSHHKSHSHGRKLSDEPRHPIEETEFNDYDDEYENNEDENNEDENNEDEFDENDIDNLDEHSKALLLKLFKASQARDAKPHHKSHHKSHHDVPKYHHKLEDEDENLELEDNDNEEDFEFPEESLDDIETKSEEGKDEDETNFEELDITEKTKAKETVKDEKENTKEKKKKKDVVQKIISDVSTVADPAETESKAVVAPEKKTMDEKLNDLMERIEKLEMKSSRDNDRLADMQKKQKIVGRFMKRVMTDEE